MSIEYRDLEAEIDRRGRRGLDGHGVERCLVIEHSATGEPRIGFGKTWREWTSDLRAILRDTGCVRFENPKHNEDLGIT